MRNTVVIAACLACAVSAYGEGNADISSVLSEASAIAEAAELRNESTVQGRDGWLFFAAELRHLGAGRFWGDRAVEVSRAGKPDYADPLPAILDFHAQLKRVGIELIMVPVPAKAAIYPEEIFSENGSLPDRLDRYHREFFEMLGDGGIQVIDATDAFLSAKDGARMYCKTDSHWSGPGCRIAAGLIAESLRKSSWFAGQPKERFVGTEREIEITGDLAAGAGVENRRETLSLRFIKHEDGEPVEPSMHSPVILLGDSHNLVFHAGSDMHASGAGLPDQLAFELGFAVDLVAVRGSGATPARVALLRRARKSGYLQGKKVVVWCFSVREFTESSGWMKVPVVR